jgi:hypothetical protein
MITPFSGQSLLPNEEHQQDKRGPPAHSSLNRSSPAPVGSQAFALGPLSTLLLTFGFLQFLRGNNDYQHPLRGQFNHAASQGELARSGGGEHWP